MSKANKKILRPVVLAASSAILLGTAFVGATSNAMLKNNARLEAALGTGYTSDYSSKAEAKAAGLDLNERICEEGMILLKNENNTLPLATNPGTQAKRISVFGAASVSPDGGGGDKADGSAGTVKVQANLYSSLQDAGYATNPVLENQYLEWKAAKKTTDLGLQADFNKAKTELEKSYVGYHDAAIVMLKEGTVEKDKDKNILPTSVKYSLQYDRAQDELIDYVTSKFDKVILLINNSKPVELQKYKDNPKIGAIMVVGNPGDNGFDAVGKILKGEVNPSGRTTDTYARDFSKDPSYNNISYKIGKGTNNYDQYKVGEDVTTSYFVHYEEGIYIGYRYYETRGFEEKAKNSDSTWYEDNVTYPFGYGLSYTSFKQEIVKSNEATLDKDGTLRVTVKVTNTGKVPGKEVVQLYTQTPYVSGQIEKAHVVLSDFAKTKVLAPGESQEVEVKVSLKDIASYDYNDKNNNKFKGYELDAGEYSFHIQSNSHTVIETKKATLTAHKFENSAATGNKIENRFDDVSQGADKFDAKLSRKDLSKATTSPTEAERVLTKEEHAKWTANVDAEYDKGKPWTAEKMPAYAKSAADRPEKAEIMLPDLYGVPLEDPKWDKLVSQLTLEEMELLINKGGFQSVSLDYIGKPFAKDTDGPKGWTGNGTQGNKLNMFAAEPVIAATWNKDLAFEMGKIIGDQGLWGNSDIDYTDGDKIYGYTGWYAPAMNTHRSPFDTRYTEYYSEDGVLAGQIAANASLGAKTKGAYVFIKHFALHDDGGGVGVKMKPNGGFSMAGYRGGEEAWSGLSVWADEQTMREVYFTPFQLAVEEGGATACMSAFNRLGSTWAGGSYALLTDVLRNEWGFKGMVVTDISIYGFLNVDQMIRAGGDLVLEGFGGMGPTLYGNDYTKGNPATQVAQMQRATKQVLYTVLNSNAMQTPIGSAVYFEKAEFPTKATVGTAYEATLQASLNTMHSYSTIEYELDDGTLPEGLSIENGKITGTPTTAGTYTFTVLASAKGYESARKTVTITVDPKPVVPGPTVDEGAREDLESTKTELEATKTELEKTKEELASTKTLVTTSLIVAIIGAVAAVASLILGFFKKKNS